MKACGVTQTSCTLSCEILPVHTHLNPPHAALCNGSLEFETRLMILTVVVLLRVQSNLSHHCCAGIRRAVPGLDPHRPSKLSTAQHRPPSSPHLCLGPPLRCTRSCKLPVTVILARLQQAPHPPQLTQPSPPVYAATSVPTPSTGTVATSSSTAVNGTCDGRITSLAALPVCVSEAASHPHVLQAAEVQQPLLLTHTPRAHLSPPSPARLLDRSVLAAVWSRAFGSCMSLERGSPLPLRLLQLR